MFNNMTQIFGDFIQNFPLEHDSLEMTFTPTSRPIKQRWKNNRLSAQFVADYCSIFLPVDEETPEGQRRIKEVQSSVSYVANELLENAMKFNNDSTNYQVKFGIQFLEDTKIKVVIYATNSITRQGVAKFQDFIGKLLSSDLEELYIDQVEKSMEEDRDASGLGFITMISNYSAKLGWKFDREPEQPQIITVTTMAQVIV
jgi:hypothetical protein